MTEPLKKTLEAGLAKAQRNLKEAEDNLAMGHIDNSVSCAYYAAFTAARVALLAEGFEPKTHEGVRGQFSLHFIKPGKFKNELSRSLRDLKEARETGDYDFFSGISKEEATEHLQDAREFVQAVEAFLLPRFKQP